MSLLNFCGGVHLNFGKLLTEKKVIEEALNPKFVYIPLLQHIGTSAESVVNIGNEVKIGQLLGKEGDGISASVHASVSGKVKGFQVMSIPNGQRANCIIIENDFKDDIEEGIKPYPYIEKMKGTEIINAIRNSGIVGMGGATFPTHIKLSSQVEKNMDIAILNGAECEPYLTCDYRLMVEEPENVVYGLRAVMRVLDVQKGFIAIEKNKHECLKKIREIVKQYCNIEVIQLTGKYPQGAEKQLIYTCTKREVPLRGLPADVGVTVCNVGTSAQIARSLKTGLPLIDRVCTLTGSIVVEPKNLRIRIGTLYRELIEQCGGFKEEPGKIISGGPMMGSAQLSLDVPVIKGTNGILCMSKVESVVPDYSNCIRCGKCIAVCPMRLQPLYISAYSLRGNYERSKEFHALDCIECGCCSYICPARRPLLQSIQFAKKQIVASHREGLK